MTIAMDINPIELAATKKQEGNEYFKAGDYSAAIKLYSEAIELDPHSSAYFANRAAAKMMEAISFEAALRDCKASIELDQNNFKSYIRACKCLIHLGRFSEAEEVLNKLERLDSSNISAISQQRILISEIRSNIELAFGLMEKKEFVRALNYLGHIQKQVSESVDLQVAVVDCLIGEEKYAEAVSQCSQLVRKYANVVQVLRVTGTASYLNGNLDSCLKYFQEALRLDPDNKTCFAMFKKVKKMTKLKQQGNEFFKANDNAAAVESYTEAVQVDEANKSFNSVIYCNRAAALMRLGQYEKAVSDCDLALELDPGYTKAYMRRAECRMKTEDFEGAVRDFEYLGQQDPNDRELRQKLREAKLELKKSKRKDHYKILGVSRDASEREIKKAYRKLALQYHPDKHGGSSEEDQKKMEEMFKDVSEAYDVLSDPEKRHRFDSGADLEEGMGMGGMHAQDMDAIFRMFAGGGGGGGGHRGHGFGGHQFHF